MVDEVLDQDDGIDAADDLCDALSRMIDVSRDHGTVWPLACVVPCVPGEPIMPGARISGIKVARIDGLIAIYLFAEAAD